MVPEVRIVKTPEWKKNEVHIFLIYKNFLLNKFLIQSQMKSFYLSQTRVK